MEIRAFKKALPGKPVVEHEGGRFNVRWDDGSVLKIEVSDTNVHYLTLVSEREGLYSDLFDSLPAYFKKQGIQTFTASPRDEASEKVLRTRGEWRKVRNKSKLVWKL